MVTKTTSRKKPAAKSSTPKKNAVKKVDYYPNKVPFLVALLAAITLLVLALITQM